LIWLAPTVLYNGPGWAQSDSIWTFFVLLSVWLFARGRKGTGAFGMAVAVKAQALFLGPFVLGMLLRRGTKQALWLVAVPVVYLLVAAPVRIAGRSVADVALVDGRQADFFHSLTMNAASVWALPPRLPYVSGTIVGLAAALAAAAAAAAAALWLAYTIARNPRRDLRTARGGGVAVADAVRALQDARPLFLCV
jgi:Gpi18-like mannosyltransferase